MKPFKTNQVANSGLIKSLGVTLLLSLLLAGIIALAHAETIQFTLKWGTFGTGNGQFDNPYDVAVDSAGYVYVADTYNHRIQKFTSDGVVVKAWGSYGTENGQFNYTMGLAIDNLGNIYVTDACNNRIQKFTSNGVFLETWGS